MKSTPCIPVLLFLVTAGLALLLFAIMPTPDSPAGTLEKTCGEIEKLYDETLSGAGGRCRTGADCDCYGPVSKKSLCGGVTDKTSARRLKELSKAYYAAKCPVRIRCAPWLCRPVCIKGRCTRGSGRR